MSSTPTYFENFNVVLLKDHHPDGYEDEWVDAGSVVQASLVPDDCYYLGSGKVPGTNMGGVFNSNAIEGIDFKRV